MLVAKIPIDKILFREMNEIFFSKEADGKGLAIQGYEARINGDEGTVEIHRVDFPSQVIEGNVGNSNKQIIPSEHCLLLPKTIMKYTGEEL